MIRSATVGIFLLMSTTIANGAVISFEPPPCDTCEQGLTSYFESGVLFLGSYSHYGMQASNSTTNDSSGAVRMAPLPANRSIQFADGSAFKLISVDLAEYMVVSSFTASPITFVGTRTDNTRISETFTVDGLASGPGGPNDFETFFFSDGFSNLQNVIVQGTSFSMDNLHISSVPIPPAVWLFLTGMVALIGISKRKS